VAKKTKSTEVAERGSSEIAQKEFDQFEGAGLENVGAADLLVPRISILQALSPQLNTKKTEYIEGAQQGDICDVGVGEKFSDGILFLPVYYRKDYLEWSPRASGKGLVSIHSSPAILDETTRDDKNKPVLPNGNYISETAQFFGFNLTAEGRQSFLPMASTQLKKARQWLTLATGEKLSRADGSSFQPPLFYRTYMLTTAEESNAEGDWFGWKIERGLTLPELEAEGHDWRELMNWAGLFKQSLEKGQAKGDTSAMGGDNGVTRDNGEAM
jgi:hypothetical protein